MEKVLFPRRVAFIESVLIEILFFFDGSNTTMEVSIYVRNHFANGTQCTRLLKNKVKLVPPDANTTPRSKLLSALICLRILNLLQGDLKTFFELFKGIVKLRAYGDSQVVLSQLLRDSYYFKVWVAIRVSEIQSLVGAIVPRVEFFHIPGTLNTADILTRPYKGAPQISTTFTIVKLIRTLPLHTMKAELNSMTYMRKSRKDDLHSIPECHK